jgi:hypothetical protein
MSRQILFIFLLFSAFSFSQELNFEAPNYKKIQKNIEDKNSEFYYPNLLKKLKENDSLITPEQYRHLYYGYTFQKEYNPYKTSENEKLLSKYFQAADLKKSDYAEIIKISKAALEEFPMNLRVMNFLGYVYHLDGNEDMAKKTSINFHGLFEAFLKSGDGLDCKTAFHVISVSHEYVLLNMFQLENVSQSLQGKCDYMDFEKGKYKINGLYFDISKLQEKGFGFN